VSALTVTFVVGRLPIRKVAPGATVKTDADGRLPADRTHSVPLETTVGPVYA
jgi:hypothetical protein